MSDIDCSFLIISGTSGSGKTIALQALEDLGYYCVDNLPASLLQNLAAQFDAGEITNAHYAVSIDSRNLQHTSELERYVYDLGLHSYLIFLDASDDILLKRFSETRRRHPLTNKQTSLAEAIQVERQSLRGLQKGANQVIDTSKLTPHELRSAMKNLTTLQKGGLMTVCFQSFGFKYGHPVDADFVFDVRCLANPYWQAKLRALSGQDQAVQDFLDQQPQTKRMYDQISTFLETWLPDFISDNRNYLTVAVGCTGGKHRSVYVALRLAKYFADRKDILVQLRHRELEL